MPMTLSGSYRVERALELRDNLMNMLAKGHGVEVSFALLQEVDLSFFQVIHAARKSFGKKGVPFTLLGDLPQSLMPLAKRSGLAMG